MEVTKRGDDHTPLEGKVLYAGTISHRLRSQEPTQREYTGSRRELMPIRLIISTIATGPNCFIR